MLTAISAFVFIKAIDISKKQEIASSEPASKAANNNNLPLFEFLQKDGNVFSKYDLDPERGTIIVFFDPDCGLCAKSGSFFKTFAGIHEQSQVLFTSAASWDKMDKYSREHKLQEVKNVTFLQSDLNQFISLFKEVGTPTYFIYDTHQKLVKIINDDIPTTTLLRYIKASQLQ